LFIVEEALKMKSSFNLILAAAVATLALAACKKP
jgi:hypothetical protein